MQRFLILFTIALVCLSQQSPAQDNSSDLRYEQYMENIQTALSYGDFQRAQLLSAEAMILDFSRPEAYLYAAMAFYKQEDLARAEKYLDMALPWCNEEQKSFAEGIRKGIKDKARFNEVFLRAEYELKRGNKAAAAQAYSQAWELFPVRADAGFQAVDLLVELKRFPEAMKILEYYLNYPDPQISKAASKIYQSLDASPQIVAKKNYERYLQMGEDYMKQQRYSDAITAYKNALQNKPGDSYLISAIARAEEEFQWQKAENSNYIEPYEEYLRKYPYGKYKEDAHRVLSAGYIRIGDNYAANRQVKDAERMYEKFLSNYRNDSRSTQVLYKMGEMYFYEGEQRIELKQQYSALSEAKAFYQAYLRVQPSGSRVEDANRKIKMADRRMHRLTIPDRTFLAWQFDSLTKVGVTIGTINQRGLGGFVMARMNPELFTPTSYYTVDSLGVADGSVLNTLPTGNFKNGRFLATIGLTQKLTRPLWIYTSAGVVHKLVLWEMDEYLSNGTLDETVWVRNSDYSNFQFLGEVGLILDVGGLNLRAGITSEALKNNYWHLGVGFSFKR